MGLSDWNYMNDRRVVGRHASHLEADDRSMTLRWVTEDDNGEEVEIEFPGFFDVCDVCDGRGSHVNPSIDCNGISQDDEFWEDDRDDDGYSGYMRGEYDQECNACAGRRVVLVIDRSAVSAELLAKYDSFLEDLAYREAERRAEMRMGC